MYAEGTFFKEYVPLTFLLCVCHVVLVVIVAVLDLLAEAVEYWDFASVRTVYKLLEVGNSASFFWAYCNFVMKFTNKMKKLVVRIDEKECCVGSHIDKYYWNFREI